MKAFAYLNPADFPAAAKALGQAPNAVAKGAGTDLLDLLKERVYEPDEVVNLLRTAGAAGEGEIGALKTLADLAADAWLQENFPAVHRAAAVAATPQIRNVGTVGGNLCQHTRCWFFRNRSFACFKRGTGACSAMEEGAQNRYHALFPHDRCASAHPSNLAPALIAVGARVACVHPAGDRTMDLELIYGEPQEGRFSDTNLRRGELIRAVLLEPSPLARRSTYVEFRERQSFDFAVASVAAAVHMEGGKVKEARIVCGAVAPTPYRARAAEKALEGKALDPAAAAAAVVRGAEPLAQSKYRVVILRRLVRRALEELKS
ncbi:MAG: FAD binding domain-containing protein [Planctomycetota bacterium]|jgi:xanthine dehydrogenase YagS FAD-binding subunit